MGCDGEISKVVTDNMGFNPRTHMGCDLDATNDDPVSFVSIHAPTWGATIYEIIKNALIEFQSTHPHGVRPKPTIM